MKKDTSLIIAIFLFFISAGLFGFKKQITFFLVKNISQKKDFELASNEKVKEIKRESGQWMVNAPPAVFLNKPVLSPLVQIPIEKRVLGETIPQEKWIEVDISDQRIFAHEGDNIVYNFPISGGKWAPTPQGTFRIWIKLRYTKMSGGSKEDGSYYYLPNVPYVMYFYKGYGIHGAYWHNNFGTPMSHGCVNMSIPDAAALFNWADPFVAANKWVAHPSKDNLGTKVVVHE